jgi:hypothetical protein
LIRAKLLSLKTFEASAQNITIFLTQLYESNRLWGAAFSKVTEHAQEKIKRADDECELKHREQHINDKFKGLLRKLNTTLVLRSFTSFLGLCLSPSLTFRLWISSTLLGAGPTRT